MPCATLNVSGGYIYTQTLQSDGAMNVTSGSVDVFGGATTVNATGSLTVNGGSFRTQTLQNNGGHVQFTSGCFEILNDKLTINAAGPLGDTVHLPAGSSLAAQSIVVGGATPGVLSIASGATIGYNDYPPRYVDSVELDAGGHLQGQGVVAAWVSNQAGFVEPGDNAQPLQIYGLEQGKDGTLKIELRSAPNPITGLSGSFDQLACYFGADLAGTLDIELGPGYLPTTGDTFRILTSGLGTSISGQFDHVDCSVLGGNLSWEVTYLPNEVDLRAKFEQSINLPEPSTFALLGMGVLSLLAYTWRRGKKAS